MMIGRANKDARICRKGMDERKDSDKGTVAT
jgi:hypothetical protein